MSKRLLYALIINCILIGVLYASNIRAQEIRSVKETRVTVSFDNADINQVIRSLEAITNYQFSYKQEDLDRKFHLTGEFKDASVAEILLEISKRSPLKFKQVNNNIHISTKTKSDKHEKYLEIIIQGITVTGKVTSAEDREGLPGVNVIVKGTTHGTVTDVEGNYSLEVPDVNSILTFSSVGFTTEEVVVGNRTVIDVTMMPDIKALEEIVVVGYGTQQKVNLTGAVSSLQGDDIVNMPVTSTTDALQGTMAGITVTRASGSPGQENFNIQIRGLTSVNSSPTLVLVDGIEGSINDVRPEDIESISVLKDAASSAIFGAKAAGGVVMITTKKGSAGKTKIEYNGYFTLSKIGRIGERVTSSRKAAEMRNISDINAGKNAPVSDEDLDRLSDSNFLWRPFPSNPNLYQFFGNYDYTKSVIREFAPMQSHNIAISGGSDKVTYRLSGTYFSDDGILKIGPDNNTRYTGRLNLDMRINKYLHLSNVFSYARNEVDKPVKKLEGMYGLIYFVYTNPGATPLYDPNGNLASGERLGAFDTKIQFYDWAREAGIDKYTGNNMRLNSVLTIENIVKGLKFRVIGVIDANYNNRFKHNKVISKYGIDGSIVGTLAWRKGVTKESINGAFKEFQFITDYNVDINNHSINLLAGYSAQDRRYESLRAASSNLINPNLPSFNWARQEDIRVYDGINTNAFQSLFGRVGYNFKERYLLEGNFRYDGSSKLSPGNRYMFFPSASAGWRMSKEPWFNLNFINELKIRGSWGQLGNAGALGNYDYIALLRRRDNFLLGYKNGAIQRSYVYQNTLASDEITWEIIETSNIGLDIALFDNKFTFSFDYFKKENKNMLARVEYPAVIGVGVPNQNAGRLKTWGWETTFGWREVKKNFSYYINGNLSDTQNELVEYLGANVISPGTRRLLEGYPVNSVFGYKTDDHFFKTQEEVDNWAFQDSRTGPGDVKYIDLNGDGIISAGNQTEEDHGDLVYLGNTGPRLTFGLQSGFTWKSLDFSMFLQGVGKRAFLMNVRGVMPFDRPWFGPQKHHEDYWTPENPDAFWPRLFTKGSFNYRPSEKWMQNAAYLRIKDIQLGYTLPHAVGSKIGIQRLRVYISGRDIWEITKTFDFIDPEFPNNSTFKYPFRRRYSIGLNLTF